MKEPCCPTPNETIAPVLSGEAYERDLAALGKAIAHPARVRILRLLAARRTCVCGTIVSELDLAQSTVSEHLRVLKASGLVQGEVDGPRTCYCLDAQALTRLKILIAAL